MSSAQECEASMEWAVCTASSDSEDATTPELNKEEEAPAIRDLQDSFHEMKTEVEEEYYTKDAKRPTDSMIDNEAASTSDCWNSMQWTECAASSNPENAATQEIKEAQGELSNAGHQDSLNEQKNGLGQQATTNYTQWSIERISQEIASIRNSCKSMGSVKAEARGNPPDHISQDLNKLSALDSVGFTYNVNISEGDGTSNSEPEDLTMGMTWEDRDRTEQVLVTVEYSREPSEELECSSSTAKNAFSTRTKGLKLNPGFSEVQRKKRYLTEDGQGQASKLVKRSVRLQENKMPDTSAECGESASDPSHSQWRESFQTRHLEGNHAAEEPTNCSESTESLSHSSKLVEKMEVHTGEVMHHCHECNITFKKSWRLKRHCIIKHHIEKSYKCPICDKCFVTADTMSRHQEVHTTGGADYCTECQRTFKNSLCLNQHCINAHIEKSYKCPECGMHFATEDCMRQHQLNVHNFKRTFHCSECNKTFDSALLLNGHCDMEHRNVKCFNCLECNRYFLNPASLRDHQIAVHNAERHYPCPECNIQFMASPRLYKHYVTVHRANENFKCPECKAYFINVDIMKRHRKKIHAAKGPFNCTESTEVFSHSSELIEHQEEYNLDAEPTSVGSKESPVTQSDTSLF